MIASKPPVALILGSALIFAACGGEGLTLPPEGEAANIAVTYGDSQSGRVGSQLADSLVVQVTDVRGRPVTGASVNFIFPDADAAAAPATATTNLDGIAWSKLTLGTQVGPVSGLAEVPVDPAITPVRATFTATALSDNANGISLVSGNDQSAPVGTALPAPLVVQVTDAFGNPIPNVTVGWTFTGGGSVSEASTVTGENGQTSVTRTLGPTAGQQTTLATAEGLAGSPVKFTHTATAGSASRVEIVSGDDQRGAPGAELNDPLVVEVVDAANNPIVNIAVEWVVAQGGGSATPASSRTDSEGRASTRWTLGPAPGNNTLNAVVSGVGRVEFTAVAEKIESSLSIISDDPDPSLVGQPVQVAVTVTGEGGTPTGSVTVAGDGAVAPCTITLSGGSGSCEIVFSQSGSRQLTATYSGDSRFAADTDTESHRVDPVPPANNPPNAEFTSSCTDLTCQFTDQSTDSDGTVQSWSWNFGDGNTSNVQNPSHTYSTGGTYTVRLTVTDNSGATDEVTHDIAVTAPAGNQPPVAVDDPDYTTPPGTELSVGADESILNNDTDPEGETLVVDLPLVQNVTGGTLEIDVSGTFQYTPDLGTTTDTFKYQARDPSGNLSNVATVTITIQ